MANGHGGKRPGAGRKRQSDRARELGGDAGHRGSLVGFPGGKPPVDTAPPELDEFDAPDDLTADERKVWLELAPHAFTARTLNRATSLGFRMLCRNVVLERAMSASVLDRGGPSHRGMIQRVDAELLRFNLAPCGKPMEAPGEPEKVPANPLRKYLNRGA